MARLARTLVGLSDKQRRRLALDDELAEAVDEAARLSNARARARQLRIVRRQLRSGDAETVERAVHRLLHPQPLAIIDTPATAVSGSAEAWVERLVAEGSVEGFMAEHPQAERQRLRTLLRNLAKASEKSAPRAKRALIAALSQTLNRP